MSKSIANHNIVVKIIGTVTVPESIPVDTAESDDSTSCHEDHMTPQSPVSPSNTLAENYSRDIGDPICNPGNSSY